MYQILFYLPLKSWFGIFYDIPIHGYGFMLFLAFVFCTLLAVYLARKQGIKAENIHDLALWLFVSGIIGARVVYVIQYWNRQFANNMGAIFSIWDGGLVFYGSALGGAVGFIGYYRVVMKPNKIRFWQMADIIAPCIALGLCLGRVGCLLNGCCYGGPACMDCPAVSFPLPAEPRYTMIRQGYQTPAGFLFGQGSAKVMVIRVEADSAAARAGLREGDEIIEAEGKAIQRKEELTDLLYNWQATHRGVNVLNLKVSRDDQEIELSFIPWSIGLHPTQIYESISTGLLLFLLLAYFPFRRHDGELFVLLMLGYSVHRFLNESIRDDTDPVAFGLTLSQNLSILIFAVAVVLGVWILRKPPQFGVQAKLAEKEPTPAAPKPAPETETALQE